MFFAHAVLTLREAHDREATLGQKNEGLCIVLLGIRM
jgi:hypothetical protein